MKVLVACEFSGTVRDAFAKRGHDAWSCDLIPSEMPGNHILGNVLDVLDDGWELMIAHPPCTHLAVSGARWFGSNMREQSEALVFVGRLLSAPIPKICLENPVSIISTHFRKPDQIIQPWMFGEDASKKTCLWLSGLPALNPTSILSPKIYACRCGWRFSLELGKYGCANCCGDNGLARLVYGNQTPTGQNRLSSSRSKERSRTYQGIADAMAEQWGNQAGRGG
jgi:hypothetical protein